MINTNFLFRKRIIFSRIILLSDKYMKFPNYKNNNHLFFALATKTLCCAVRLSDNIKLNIFLFTVVCCVLWMCCFVVYNFIFALNMVWFFFRIITNNNILDGYGFIFSLFNFHISEYKCIGKDRKKEVCLKQFNSFIYYTYMHG